MTGQPGLGNTFRVMDSISLKELASRISVALAALDSEYWVVAEVAQANVNQRSGHCYLELVEKKDDKLLAKISANIWKWVYKKIEAKFSLATGSEIGAGMKVLLLVEVKFHEIYGLSLNVKDVDPSYTLGDMARKRQETIERLEKEGIFNKNKETSLTLLPSRIAVISSETAAGYGDFLNTLKAGRFGFKITLYPAFMQGAKTEESVISALRAIREKAGQFDAVALIRGGGSQVDLSYFDSYALARQVALFPLPVLAGIGHERDESVAGLVAHTRLITPTAVAEFLIGRFEDFEARVDDCSRRLAHRAKDLLLNEQNNLRHMTDQLVSRSRAIVQGARHTLQMSGSGLLIASHKMIAVARGTLDLGKQKLIACAGKLIERKTHILQMQAGGFQNLARTSLKSEIVRFAQLGAVVPKGVLRLIKGQRERLDTLGSSIRLMDPVNVLMRGYSITTNEGKAVTDAAALDKGDILTTRLARGEVSSVVEDTRKETDG